MFSGEVIFEDWFPALQRAAMWNGWSVGEALLQLAGHLRGRALEEWNLMDKCEKKDLNSAADALRRRLEPSSKVLAAQDFRHASQKQEEPIADYIWRLEMFCTAYGRERISSETRDALLLSHAGRFEV